jgi:acetyl-CoA carboxylase alpha subunit
MFKIVKKHIKEYIKELNVLPVEKRINDRIDKFCKMGVWK